MNPDRPRLILKPTFLDIILDGTSIAGILFIWVYVFIRYTSLPEIIPVHFSFDGKADNYGNRATIFIMPAIITVVTAGLFLLNRFPHIFNYSKKINAENAFREYTRATRLLRVITLIIVVFNSILTIDFASSAREGFSRLTWWVIPLFMLSMLMPIFMMLYQSSGKKREVKP